MSLSAIFPPPSTLPSIASASPRGELEAYLKLHDFLVDPESLAGPQSEAFSRQAPRLSADGEDPIGDALLEKEFRRRSSSVNLPQPSRLSFTTQGPVYEEIPPPRRRSNSLVVKAGHGLEPSLDEDAPPKRGGGPIGGMRRLRRALPSDSEEPDDFDQCVSPPKRQRPDEVAATDARHPSWPEAVEAALASRGPKAHGDTPAKASPRQKLRALGGLSGLLDESLDKLRAAEERERKRERTLARSFAFTASTKLKAAGKAAWWATATQATPAAPPEAYPVADNRLTSVAERGAEDKTSGGAAQLAALELAPLAAVPPTEPPPKPAEASPRRRKSLPGLSDAPKGVRAAAMQVRETLELHELWKTQRKAAAGGGGGGGRIVAAAVKVPLSADFGTCLKAYFPHLSAAEVEEQLAWVARKEAEQAAQARKQQGTDRLSKEQRHEVAKLFERCDADHSGSIELEELQEAGWGAAGTPEGDELIRQFSRLDTSGNGSINLEQFTTLIEECATKLGIEEIMQQVAKSTMSGVAAPHRYDFGRRPSLADLASHNRAVALGLNNLFAKDDE